MAGNISENHFRDEMLDFKTQMLRFVEVAGQKFDGLTSDVRDNSFRLDKVEQKLSQVEQKLSKVEQNLGHRIDELDRSISIKIDQVTEKVVDHEKRLRSLERGSTTSPAVN